MMDQNTIEGSVLSVVIYFDLFDYPLTVWEVYKYLLHHKADYLNVENCLLALCQSGKISFERGFYFVPGRSNLIDERQKRYSYFDRKMKKADMATRIFRFIPWVSLIAIGNLIGAQNMRDDSDIDFFIVTHKNRIWLTRFLCASIASIMHWRPQDNNSRDKICLSFFISEEDLSLDRFRWQEQGEIIDKYFTYWLAGLLPIYDRDDAYSKLISRNSWLHNELPNNIFTLGKIENLIEKDGYKFIDNLEKKIRQWQTNHFPEKIKSLMNQDSRVVIDDHTLKMHINDRRAIYENNFQSAWKKYVN